MKYCFQCGTKLSDKLLENEGMIPFCSKCHEYRFPIFNTAVSVIIQNPQKNKILLIKQYSKNDFILVAGYVNKGENAEHAVIREVMEEIGITVTNLKFNKSEYFEKSSTLMLNFSCEAATEKLDNINYKEVDFAEWLSVDDARKSIKSSSLAQEFLFAFLSNSEKQKSDLNL